MNQLRRDRIAAYLENNEAISIHQLQEMFPDVSSMTIHRDLDALEAEGLLVKIRGGARAVRRNAESQLEVRKRENKGGKLSIIQKALKLIQPGSCVFFDAGSTNLLLAKSIPDINLTIFTTAPNIAIELCKLVKPSINLCCGNLNRTNLSLSGHNTLNMLESINIDLAFVGVSGCSAAAGLTCGAESDMYVKRLVIDKARTSVALCDSDKLTRLMPFTFAKLGDVDYIITDDNFPDSFIQAATAVGTTVL